MTNKKKSDKIQLEKRKENKIMTKQEIQNKIEELEERKFYNNMVDRWTNENYELDFFLRNEIEKLKKELTK